MGQKMQIIFKTRKKYYNEGSPNNKNENILVFNNQWCYGVEAINITYKIVKEIRKVIRENKKDYKNNHLDWEDILINIMNKINLLNDCVYPERNHLDYNYNEMKENWNLEELKRYDNNNGFIIIDLSNNKKQIKLCFYTGDEDKNIIEYETPESYLYNFGEEEIKRFNERQQEQIKKMINSLMRLNTLSEIEIKNNFTNTFKKGDE